MYNGMSLQLTRSPNKGYVQRNVWFVKKPIEYKSEDDFKRLDRELNRVPNKDILEHQNKRQIELKCLKMEDQMEQQGTNYKRSVNLVTLSAEQELKRYESQRFCETVSLIAIIFGLLLGLFSLSLTAKSNSFSFCVTITPFLLIPIWVIPNAYSPIIRNFLWVSMLMTVTLLTLAALTGNIYWYYDEKSQKWKWFYHCGKGPQSHYWGKSLFTTNILKRLAKSDRRNNISINV